MDDELPWLAERIASVADPDVAVIGSGWLRVRGSSMRAVVSPESPSIWARARTSPVIASTTQTSAPPSSGLTHFAPAAMTRTVRSVGLGSAPMATAAGPPITRMARPMAGTNPRRMVRVMSALSSFGCSTLQDGAPDADAAEQASRVDPADLSFPVTVLGGHPRPTPRAAPSSGSRSWPSAVLVPEERYDRFPDSSVRLV